MKRQLTIRFSEEDITWLTDKTYKAKQIESSYYNFPFDFKDEWHLIRSYGYTHPNLFKGHNVLSTILGKYLNLIVWDAEEDQINIAATGFIITLDLPTTKKSTLEKTWWRHLGLGSSTLKKTLIILEKLGYLTLLKTKPKPGYTRINLNISKCNQSLKVGQLELDTLEVTA